ncbi:MAG: hypothetical protein AB7U05_12910 [Mangrovibacterium sp.]
MNNATKYFVSRCNELLNQKTFDSYRVSLHTPLSIFKELDQCIVKYNNKQIKRYDPTISVVIEEAISLLENENIADVFEFGKYLKDQVFVILKNSLKSDQKIRSLSLLSRSLISVNSGFRNNLFSQIKTILVADDRTQIKKLNCLASWLMSELMYAGYSRSFIKSRIRKFSDLVIDVEDLTQSIEKLCDTFNHDPESYRVIFKIKLTDKDAFRVNSLSLDTLSELPFRFQNNPSINNAFKSLKNDELFIATGMNGYDFKEVIKKSYPRISEVIDVNILHQSDNSIILDKQVFCYHLGSHRFRMEPLADILDGYYAYQEQEFDRFSRNYDSIAEGTTAREKLRSAIRFYKLGNESADLEHKILNYWIGFEQLYSSEFTEEDSIKRIKVFFTALNSSFYLQRRANYLIDTLNRFSIQHDGQPINRTHLFSEATLKAIQQLCIDDALAYHRLTKYIGLFYAKKEIKTSLEKHLKRLDQHLTRIYRIRNEVVHEGRASANLELVAGHLRHYLLFSIEQITNTLAENPVLENLDDVFVHFENLFEQVKTAADIQEVFSICDYKGYME